MAKDHAVTGLGRCQRSGPVENQRRAGVGEGQWEPKWVKQKPFLGRKLKGSLGFRVASFHDQKVGLSPRKGKPPSVSYDSEAFTSLICFFYFFIW
jgi:hypothetical protein